jgi:hypothetical protein
MSDWIDKALAAKVRRARRNLDKARAEYDAVIAALTPLAAAATRDAIRRWAGEHVTTGTRVHRDEKAVMSMRDLSMHTVPTRDGSVSRLHLGRKHIGVWIRWDGVRRTEFVSLHEFRRMVPGGLPEVPKTMSAGDLVREVVDRGR